MDADWRADMMLAEAGDPLGKVFQRHLRRQIEESDIVCKYGADMGLL